MPGVCPGGGGGKLKLELEKAVNVDFVLFIRGVRVLCKPRPE